MSSFLNFTTTTTTTSIKKEDAFRTIALLEKNAIAGSGCDEQQPELSYEEERLIIRRCYAYGDEQEQHEQQEQQIHLCDNLPGYNDDYNVETSIVSKKQQRSFEISSLLFGIIIGTFLQVGAFGLNYMYMLEQEGQQLGVQPQPQPNTTNTATTDEQDEDELTRMFGGYIASSMISSFICSGFAIILLILLRALVSHTFSVMLQNKGVPVTKQQQEDQHNIEVQLLNGLLRTMEYRFVAGSLIGIAFAWSMVDLAFGLYSKLVCSVVTLIIALVFYRFSFYWKGCCYVKPTTKTTKTKTTKTTNDYYLV